MFTSTLLVVASIIFFVLACYGISYFFSSLLILRIKSKDRNIEKGQDKSVTVLVPSHNEGVILVDAINSLLSQKHSGQIFIKVLVKNQHDTSLPLMREHFKLDKEYCLISKNIELRFIFTGHQSKTDKINSILPSIDTDYISFLDADHRADPRWLLSSIAKLENSDSVAIQSTRAPLDERKLFQFWDSMQNHVGNEGINTVFSKLGLGTFFTGTTCTFKAEVFSDRLFPESLTEDTRLSYELLSEGKKIEYGPHYGSVEEVAPDLSTYVARRRRWSSGHNHSFLKTVNRVLRSDKSILEKIQYLMHGLFFFVPTLIVILLNCFGIFTFIQLDTNLQYFNIFTSFILSAGVTYTISSNKKDWAQNLLFVFIFIFPQLAILSIGIYKILGNDIYFSLISFPYLNRYSFLPLLLLIQPLIFLFITSIKLKKGNLKLFSIYIFTFPFVLLIDIFSMYLGFIDHLFGRKTWGKLKRSNTVHIESIPEEMRKDMKTGQANKKVFYSSIFIPVSILSLIVINDLLVFDNCGNPEYLLSRPLLFDSMGSDTKINVSHNKAIIDRDNFQLTTKIKLSQNTAKQVTLYYQFNGEEIKSEITNKKNNTIFFNKILPLGFDTHKIKVGLSGSNSSCQIKSKVSTSVKEIKNGLLHLNGEEFLIKGLIPSFKTGKIGINYDQGFKQFKSIGVNTIRSYHTPSKEMLRFAKKHFLMIVSQPDQTTWDNFSLGSSGGDKELKRRYYEHRFQTEGEPHILIDNLGNELFLRENKKEALTNFKKGLKQIREDPRYRFPISYSTYYTFLSLGVDILGVNMLDTGDVYWKSGLKLLRHHNKAFYASEFGGFEAFYEKTSPLVRAFRFIDHWKKITASGGSGAIFFQSHDNWAQPVPEGHNDPLSPDQADDTRGIWNHQNKPKLEAKYLKSLYEDVQLLRKSEKLLKVVNKRSYSLNDLRIKLNDKEYIVGNIDKFGDYELEIDGASSKKVFVGYRTHKGLVHGYEVKILNKKGEALDMLLKKESSCPLVHHIIDGKKIGFTPEKVLGGEHILELSFDKNLKTYLEYDLVLEGIGANEIAIETKDSKVTEKFKVHSYREKRIAVSKLQSFHSEKTIRLKLKRNLIQYIGAKYSINGNPVLVKFKKPCLQKVYQ